MLEMKRMILTATLALHLKGSMDWRVISSILVFDSLAPARLASMRWASMRWASVRLALQRLAPVRLAL